MLPAGQVRKSLDAPASLWCRHDQRAIDSLGLVALGLLLLVAGGELLLRGAVAVATLARVTPAVIGLTVVAAGTSVPELAVSLIAALRGSEAIAVGNVVGSNIFNLLLILGAAGLIAPIEGALSVYAVVQKTIVDGEVRFDRALDLDGRSALEAEKKALEEKLRATNKSGGAADDDAQKPTAGTR